MKKYKLLLLPFFSFLIFSRLNAQETVTTTGGNATSNQGTVNYTIGQVLYSSPTGSNGSEAQGVQQPYEIWITSINDILGIKLQVAAYPNPTLGELWLTIDNYADPSLKYELYDFTGKLLKTEPILDEKTKIEMQNFATATYLLRVTNNSSLIQTFTIIKN